jgi:hypothetical protein
LANSISNPGNEITPPLKGLETYIVLWGKTCENEKVAHYQSYRSFLIRLESQNIIIIISQSGIKGKNF